ncbi:MAG: site-2 protease family protein [Chloroflexota bacterium]
MRNSIRLFRIAGIDIGIHYTWIFLFILVTWSLAAGFLPQGYPGWSQTVYWVTGAIASLLLFLSILLHELAHSLVARARGMSVNSITLFIFGGVSNLEDEPTKPRTEFVMAIVGPLTSLILGGILWGVLQVIQTRQSPLGATLLYLSQINLILAAFNLLPGFPLDGGRVLRSILWGSTGNLVKATNIAGVVGIVFGWGLIGFGVFQLLGGNFLGGIWFAIIGWFLSNAADSSRRDIAMRQQLAGIQVKDVMNVSQETISPKTPVNDVVWDIFHKRHGRAVPVCDSGRLMGIVTLTDVKGLPTDKWAATSVESIMTRQPLFTVKPEDDLSFAMKLIAQHDVNQVLVLQEGQCAGILSRADIIRHLQLRQELGFAAK